MSNPILLPAIAILPRPEVDNLLEAWLAYDKALMASPRLSHMTQVRRDRAADALYDVMFMASTGTTLADLPPSGG
ncbi:hypothetical protein EDC30_10983 [Paucimonas lemoignei]|uniref:Uncharacterized protein n=1 Tax=Paucimonas lemoignei TaxID=29443 RepID=A0A4R3HSX8_PAULE|nr:hypothetical protein [Paucimonas lemoignei]TCS35784.1 hypothetical protein EDC30_10983 [Paucimonas lemoignei]